MEKNNNAIVLELKSSLEDRKFFLEKFGFNFVGFEEQKLGIAGVFHDMIFENRKINREFRFRFSLTEKFGFVFFSLYFIKSEMNNNSSYFNINYYLEKKNIGFTDKLFTISRNDNLPILDKVILYFDLLEKEMPKTFLRFLISEYWESGWYEHYHDY